MAASSDDSTLNVPLKDSEKTPRHLLWLGLLCLLVYGATLGFYLDDTLSGPRANREVFSWLSVLALAYLYWHGYRTLSSLRHPVPVLVAFAAGFALLAFLTPPFHSTDLYGYINRGWQQVGYGANPYVLTVDDIAGWQRDPMFTNHWVNNPSPYGFLYIQIAKCLTALGGGDFDRTVMIFKAFNVLVHALVAALVWWGANLARLRRPDLALYLYTWNPLILLHALANGHNDLVMGLFVTLAGVASLAGVWLWVIPALVAGTLVKYGALVILPVAGLTMMRLRAWQAIVLGLLLGGLVFALSGWMYLQDWEQFRLGAIQGNAQVSHASLHSFLFSTHKAIIGVLSVCASPDACEQAKLAGRAVLKYILLAGYGVFYLWMLRQVWFKQVPTAHHYVENTLLVLAGLVCLISLKFYPWYFGMFFPLALFLEEGHWLRRLVVLASGFQLLSFTFVGQAHFLNFLLMLGVPIGWIAWQEWQKRQTVSRV